MAKFREPQNPHPLNVSILDLYRQTLWFVIDECCDSKSQEEKEAILRRISNEIFETPLRVGRGRPRMASDRRLRALRGLMEQKPGLTAHAAASEIARNDPDPIVEPSSLVRRLLRQLDASGENYAKWGSKTMQVKLPVSIEQLEADGKAHWDRVNDSLIADLLSALEKSLRQV